jgi:putative ABC transport system substrate-binding protein
MRRREFLGVLGGAAAAWPMSAQSQQPQRMRRVGVLLGLAENDAEARALIAAFRQELAKLGWPEGRDLRVDVRFGGDDIQRIRALAAELVGFAPDVIFTGSQPVLDVMRETTRSVPIVFIQVTDPVGRGLVASLARPNGNLTGLANYDSMGGKLLQILREIVPSVVSLGVVLHPDNASNIANFAAMEALAPSIRAPVSKLGVRSSAEIERSITEFASQPNRGMIVLANPNTNANRALIIELAARYKLPAVYPYRYFVADGGLISYGVDIIDVTRRATFYVNRILRGDKPGDLPIQQPTKFELILNLKTAKALGLTVPESFLLRADEVIE